MSKNYTFEAGPRSRDDTEGNGKWSVKAQDAASALRAIFASVTYPGELVGRFEDVFVDGVSLPGLGSNEVVQLWSDEHDVIARTAEFGDRWMKANGPQDHHFHFPHTKNAWTCRSGLVMEIPVTAIGEHLAVRSPFPQNLALPAPGDRTALSPIGRLVGVGMNLEHRQKLHLAVQDARLRQAKSVLAIEGTKRDLSEKRHILERQLAVLNTYMHGMTAAEIVNSGERAPAGEPYHVFQSRLYLDQEIGLLVNLQHFDFRDVAVLDEWLLATGFWRKLLPHPKTILVTRVKAKERDYGDWLTNLIANHWNMQNLVWVRDGDFIFRFATDISFSNEVFKATGEVERVGQKLTEHLFEARFKDRDDSEKVRVGVVKDAERARFPYERGSARDGFASLEAWLDSETCTDGIKTTIHAYARQFVEGKNMQRLPFLVLLQGMVDNSTVLSVPPGTNLLDAVSLGRYFRLVYDKDGALPDRSGREQLAQAIAPLSQKRGEWIVARVGRDQVQAKFYQVVSGLEGGVTVRYTPKSRRYPYEPLTTTRTRKIRRFLPVTLDDDLAARLLDDRDWKIKNPDFVPILALWKKVKRYISLNPVNEGVLDLGRGLTVIDPAEEEETHD